MAEFQYGVSKVHGFTTTGYESITSNFEYIKLSSLSVDIRPFDQFLTENSVTATTASGGQLVSAAASQAALDKLIQIVSERGQPVIMGNVVTTTPPNTGPWVVYMTLEHPAAWKSVTTSAGGYDGGAAAHTAHALQAQIILDGINHGFDSGGALVTVTTSTTLHGTYA